MGTLGRLINRIENDRLANAARQWRAPARVVSEVKHSINFMTKLKDIVKRSGGLNRHEASLVNNTINAVKAKFNIPTQQFSLENYVGNRNAMKDCDDVISTLERIGKKQA